jgi:hypothetical protein
VVQHTSELPGDRADSRPRPVAVYEDPALESWPEEGGLRMMIGSRGCAVARGEEVCVVLTDDW